MTERVYTITVQHVKVAAPPTPACFSDRDAWVYYLLVSQQHGKSAAKPFDSKGVFRADWNFCVDCTLEHTTLMTRKGKCDPSQFRAPLREGEKTHEHA